MHLKMKYENSDNKQERESYDEEKWKKKYFSNSSLPPQAQTLIV